MERRITRPMLYQKGRPSRMLSDDEADLFVEVRGEVSRLLHLNAQYLDREAIHGRYAELLAIQASRGKRT
ncbi:hypothetical protein [Bosea sp. AK1]|uniref:hypothetical protein n=1 Tax=Bosea sp. AK1 TaxID=2587160 RepID=UPI0020BF21C8|nr:hypothetical protein [Bosea sp. AK1]